MPFGLPPLCPFDKRSLASGAGEGDAQVGAAEAFVSHERAVDRPAWLHGNAEQGNHLRGALCVEDGWIRGGALQAAAAEQEQGRQDHQWEEEHKPQDECVAA